MEKELSKETLKILESLQQNEVNEAQIYATIAGFIKNETGVTYKTGNFVDKTGKILGQHKGIIHYTIGQRKGLGIAMGEPVFVSKI